MTSLLIGGGYGVEMKKIDTFICSLQILYRELVVCGRFDSVMHAADCT